MSTSTSTGDRAAASSNGSNGTVNGTVNGASRGPSNALPPMTAGLPHPTRRRRRPALIGLAVLLIVGSAAVAGLLAVRLDSRSPALVAAREISVGQQISREDLTEERIAGDGLKVLGADQAARVVGSYASEDIPAGRLLDADMVQQQGFLKTGTVAVGVAVPSGRMPASGLRSGDKVQVVQVVEGEATVLVSEAIVSTAPAQSSTSGGGQFLGGPSTTASDPGAGVATLIVRPDEGPKVAAASAANRISLVLLTRGEGLPGQ